VERLTGPAADELLDGHLDDPETLRDNLRDLRRINHVLGGVRLSRRAIGALAGDRQDLSIVDVGTGGADIPVALLADARRRGRRLRVTAIDVRSEVLAAAVAARPGLDSIDGLELVVGDGRRLAFPDAAFSIAHSSLVLHHLDPPDALAVLREMRRVAELGIVVNDLARGRLPWLGARLMTGVLTRNRYTRHDGPLSVRRAYTRGETRELLAAAGLRPIREYGGFGGHRHAFAAVPL
jgi:ubiquinone/menaquinone biosynthesis C-methylase UbiE